MWWQGKPREGRVPGVCWACDLQTKLWFTDLRIYGFDPSLPLFFAAPQTRIYESSYRRRADRYRVGLAPHCGIVQAEPSVCDLALGRPRIAVSPKLRPIIYIPPALGHPYTHPAVKTVTVTLRPVPTHNLCAQRCRCERTPIY